MNKIVIENEEIKEELNTDIEVVKKSNHFDIRQIKIDIKKDTELFLENNSKQNKIEFIINIKPNISCNIYEIKTGDNGKYNYKYTLNENSKLNIYKINDIDNVKEMLSFNLNGENAYLNYNFKTIGIKKEKYDILVYHNKSNTESLINNNGVNKEGEISFNVSGFVPNKIKGCTLNQNGRIINLTNNKCQIKPNLFIDENDVIANHSAHIGKCNEEEIFYLMSRGLPYNVCENLIIKGFLLKNTKLLKEKMETIINKYWR